MPVGSSRLASVVLLAVCSKVSRAVKKGTPTKQGVTYHTKAQRDICHVIDNTALMLGAVLRPPSNMRFDHYPSPIRSAFSLLRPLARGWDQKGKKRHPPFDPYRNGCAPLSLTQILCRAPAAMMGRAVMCRRNLPDLVIFPRQVPKLRRASRLTQVARLAMDSLT